MSRFVDLSLAIGFIGDFLLQAIVYIAPHPNLFGLKSYFDLHGSIESAFIASGMMGCFMKIYQWLDPSLNIYGLSLYAAGLDLAFRYSEIFPSLKDYYEYMPVPQSILWAIIPALLPRLAMNIYASYTVKPKRISHSKSSPETSDGYGDKTYFSENYKELLQI